MRTIHPRPNPIIAALYMLRDMDVDVVVIHGPAGCGFMASRMIEEAGIRVVSSSIRDSDLIFGASEPLISTLKAVREKFDPRTVAVIGTCASMIIGEDMEAAIKRADIGCNVFAVDCHGCMGDNTRGAIKAVESACDAGMITSDESKRQQSLLRSATRMEKTVGMATKDYLPPSKGLTKLGVSKMILDTLSADGKVAVAMIAKKELAYRFADMFLAVDEAKKRVGGDTLFLANLDSDLGLPRIRRYAKDILDELNSKDITIDAVTGGLDEYAIVGERMIDAITEYHPDLLVILGIPHAYPNMGKDDILITDQPRQLANYLENGFTNAVGEIASHSLVMSTRSIVPMETGDTIREMLRDMP